MGFRKGEEVVGLGRHGKAWPSRPRGTVVAVRADSVFVAWHGTVVEDEMHHDEVQPADLQLVVDVAAPQRQQAQ